MKVSFRRIGPREFAYPHGSHCGSGGEHRECLEWWQATGEEGNRAYIGVGCSLPESRKAMERLYWDSPEGDALLRHIGAR